MISIIYSLVNIGYQLLNPFRLVELTTPLFRREAVLLIDLIAITIDTILPHTYTVSCNLVVIVNKAASFLEDIKECRVSLIGLVNSLHSPGFILTLLALFVVGLDDLLAPVHFIDVFLWYLHGLLLSLLLLLWVRPLALWNFTRMIIDHRASTVFCRRLRLGQRGHIFLRHAD
nr:MAG TPA: hypothetical protein [Podoviridae sp. ctK5Q1]